MTYQELINNIRDLGFSDNEEIEDFGELVYSGINRAITEISTSLAPIKERYEFSIDDTDTGYMYITMPDIDDMFLDFEETPILYERETQSVTKSNSLGWETTSSSTAQTWQPFNDYDIEAGDTMVINADEHKGSFRIIYRADHEPLTGTEAQLREDLPLPRKAHFLVPLLASYYIWLDDDVQKATMYYNQYETFAGQMIANRENKPKGRILPGGI